MQKNKVHLEVEKNEKNYVFICGTDATLGEIYDVLHQMVNHIVTTMHQVNESKKQEENKE